MTTRPHYKEAERLWGAKAGTPDADRLDVLATLIHAYEAFAQVGTRVDHNRLMVSAGTAALAAEFAFKKVKP